MANGIVTDFNESFHQICSWFAPKSKVAAVIRIALASTVTLTHYVCKTHLIQTLPVSSRVEWMTVVQGLTLKSFHERFVNSR
jgi:hypothetical protein